MAESYGEALKKMELRNAAVAANAADLPHLEPKRFRLSEVLVEARSLLTEQASLAARKQEVTRRLAELIQEGNTLVAFLNSGVRQHYGRRSEKLSEFGVQPFRGLRRSPPEEPPGQPPIA
jgi:hypothetical protein